MAHADKQVAYAADITYGTNNEFGFDYLRDNMVFATDASACSAGFSYAIVDEVDSILIDEARTPLIISGQADDNVDTYYRLNEIAAEAHAPGRTRRAPATTGSTRRRTRCCCPRKGHENARGAARAGGADRRRDRASTTRTTSRSCITCTRRCARTRCSIATSTTSCRTAR